MLVSTGGLASEGSLLQSVAGINRNTQFIVQALPHAVELGWKGAAKAAREQHGDWIRKTQTV